MKCNLHNQMNEISDSIDFHMNSTNIRDILPKSDKSAMTTSFRSIFLKSLSMTYLLNSMNVQSTLAVNRVKKLDFKPATAIGYQAAQSVYSPGQSITVVPLLPQSALINSLPFNNELIGQIQAYLESFVQLINPTPVQRIQLDKNDSSLWINLRINSQRAAGIIIHNRQELLPDPNFPYENIEIYIKSYEFANNTFNQLRSDALKLINASNKAQVSECLKYMRKCLTSLADIAYILTNPLTTFSDLSMNPKQPKVFQTTSATKKFNDTINMKSDLTSTFDRLSIYNFTTLTDSFANIPMLIGRAMVTLTFQRPGSALIMESKNLDVLKEEKSIVKLIVDGINHPYTAGNFIDLCKKKYYDSLPIREDKFEDFIGVMSGNINITSRKILGDFENGYIDPVLNIQRRIPLEVLRENENGLRYTVLGSARNSLVFTKAKPVLSFATYGSIGMFHSKGDNNAASSSFFWIPADQSTNVIERDSSLLFSQLNNQYSLFAYAIEGNDVLEKLQQGDLLVSAVAEDGLWELVYDKYNINT